MLELLKVPVRFMELVFDGAASVDETLALRGEGMGAVVV